MNITNFGLVTNIINFGSSWEFPTKTFPYPPFKNHEIIDLDGSTDKEIHNIHN
jgi:hypothetical protein